MVRGFMRLLRIIVIFLAVLGFSVADARQIIPEYLPDPKTELPLAGDDLKAIFQDRTPRGYYQYDAWVEREPAFTERMNADGTAIHQQDGVTSIGTWRTRHNVVCFEYDDMMGGCFNVYKKGTCYFALSALSNDIVAITVLDDEIADCEPSFA